MTVAKKVRVLIVGCGRQGEKHLKAYLSMKNVEPIVCEADERRARKLEATYGVRYVIDYEKALADLAGELDAIDICTPTRYHYDYIIKALKAGLHVFCEKPLAPTYEQAKAIADEAEKRGLRVMVGFLFKFHPAMRLVEDVLAKGVLGRPYLALFRIGGRGGHRKWKHVREEYGGAILEITLHVLDLALWFFGDVEEVELLHQAIILPEREVRGGQRVRVTAEDLVLCRLLMKNGVEVLCEADQITPSYMNYMEVLGDEGIAFTSILDYMPTTVFLRQIGTSLHVHRFDLVNLVKEELSYFVSCLARGIRNELNTARESAEIARIADQLRMRVYELM